MNPFEMVVIIVALGILGMVVKYYLDNRSVRRHQGDELEKCLASMETRLRNLEAIVTSETWELERKFRELDQHSDRDP